MLLDTQKINGNTVETFLEAIVFEEHNCLICSGKNTEIYQWYCDRPQNVRRFQNFRSFIKLCLIYSFLMIEITRFGYLKPSRDFRLYSDTKIMSVGALENIRHPILKKRPPHLPFESYFSIFIFE